MRKRVFELIAGHPALDFVNTLDDRFGVGGPKDLLESYADLVSFTEQSGLLPPKKGARLMREQNSKACERWMHEARHVREALASVLYAFVDGRRTSANELNRLADWIQGTQKKLILVSEQGHFAWKLPDEIAVEWPLRLLALSAGELITSGRMKLLRACAKDDCRWLFLDTSKNHTRRWCDMKICGNRVKAMRFKAQHGVEAARAAPSA
jgi:predicted RNA-binding Zn ribbon-like protein